jgi:hypothetical protein
MVVTEAGKAHELQCVHHDLNLLKAKGYFLIEFPLLLEF